MNTIFRRVSAKERLPKKDGVYIALRSGYTMGDWDFKNGEWTHEGNEGVKYELEWWLEEIELPSNVEILKEFGATDSSEGDKINRMWMEGAKWMRDFVLAVTPK